MTPNRLRHGQQKGRRYASMRSHSVSTIRSITATSMRSIVGVNRIRHILVVVK
jgi:hypothetical protein